MVFKLHQEWSCGQHDGAWIDDIVLRIGAYFLRASYVSGAVVRPGGRRWTRVGARK